MITTNLYRANELWQLADLAMNQLDVPPERRRDPDWILEYAFPLAPFVPNMLVLQTCMELILDLQP
jgi:hypothetical protein